MNDQSLRNAQLRQEFRAEIMRGYQAALCNSDVPGWTLGDEVAKVADNLLAAHPAEPAVDDLAARLRASVDAAKARRLAHPAEPAPGVSEDGWRCAHCGDEIDLDEADYQWRSTGDFGDTGSGVGTSARWCEEGPGHQHGPILADPPTPAPSAPVVTNEAVEEMAAQLYRQVWEGNRSYADASDAEKDACREAAGSVLTAVVPLLGPRLILDERAVATAIADSTGHLSVAITSVMELARPMPTQEQIEQTVADAAAATGLARYFKSGSLTDPSDLDEFTHAFEVLLNGAES